MERAERWRWQSSSGSLVAYHQLEIKNWFLSWHHTFFFFFFFDEIRITDISLVSFLFLNEFFSLGVVHTLYIWTKTNEFFSRVVMAYLEQLQREIKDFLAPFSTIQLKKKRTIITTRFFLNAHIKTTKQHLHPIPTQKKLYSFLENCFN